MIEIDDLDDDAILARLGPTPFEIEQRQHTIIARTNELRARKRLREKNKGLGFDPKPGAELYVRADGTMVMGRSRAGLRFVRHADTVVTVIEAKDDEVTRLQRDEKKNVVNIWGADQIFEDSSLHTKLSPAREEDLAETRRQAARAGELAEQLTAERARIAKLEEQVRRARSNAPESSDGRPSRLAAAAAARETAGLPTPIEPDAPHGADDFDEPKSAAAPPAAPPAAPSAKPSDLKPGKPSGK